MWMVLLLDPNTIRPFGRISGELVMMFLIVWFYVGSSVLVIVCSLLV